MKQFKKDEQRKFVCEECGRAYKNMLGLSIHVSAKHFSIKLYFDKWIKEETDDKCKICGKETLFRGLIGYKNCCCKKCSDKYRYIQYSLGCLRIYGVDNSCKVPDVIQKTKETNKKRYGVTCTLNTEENIKKKKETWQNNYSVDNPRKATKVKNKIKQTCVKHYGVDNPAKSEEVKDKTKETNKKRYGVEWQTQSENFKTKAKKTWLENYGTENPQQNKDVCEKGQKSALTLKQFKNIDIWYQGKNELDFLENYYNIFPDIIRGPSFKYIGLDNKQHIYHSDFFIPSLNLIVEIKNSWLLKRDKDIIELKKQAVLFNNYKYILIVDKNCDEFKKLYC